MEQGPEFAAQPVGAFLAALASDQPAPGGGAAGALAAASGASLIEMVCRFSQDRSELRQWADEIARRLNEAEGRRAELLAAMDADAAAFAAVTTALALPRRTREERTSRRQAIDEALVGAAQPPLQVAAACAELATSARSLVGRTNPHLVSDLGSAGALLSAGLRIARFNVEANARSLKADPRATELRAQLAAFRAHAEGELASLEAAVHDALHAGSGAPAVSPV